MCIPRTRRIPGRWVRQPFASPHNYQDSS
jgi:hypothetical protein